MDSSRGSKDDANRRPYSTSEVGRLRMFEPERARFQNGLVRARAAIAGPVRGRGTARRSAPPPVGAAPRSAPQLGAAPRWAPPLGAARGHNR